MARRKAVAPAVHVSAVRALGLRQPLATLLVRGYMPTLRLPYGVSYRGPLWIYSALCWNEDIKRICNAHRSILNIQLGYSRARPLPLGCLIGRAVLADCSVADPGCYDIEDEEVVNVLAYRLFYERVTHSFMYDWKFKNIEYLEDMFVVKKIYPSPALFRVETVPGLDLAAARLLPAAPERTLSPVRIF